MNRAIQQTRLPRWALPLSLGVALMGAGVFALLRHEAGLVAPTAVAAGLFLILYLSWSAWAEGKRRTINRLATALLGSSMLVVLVPLSSLLWTLVARGVSGLSGGFFHYSMRNVSPNDPGGGIYHAMVGTVQQVAMASIIALPLGILAAVYLVEYGRGTFTSVIRLLVDVMTGVPSIIAGLFIYSFWVLTLGFDRAGFAGALALLVLMVPVVIRSTEEMLERVPTHLREASLALGIPRWRTITRVVLPTALSGIVTGSMLAIARIAGETAPLLLTTFLAQNINWNLFSGPQATIPTFVWSQFALGTEASIDRAWAAALVLVILIAVLYAVAHTIATIFKPQGLTR